MKITAYFSVLLSSLFLLVDCNVVYALNTPSGFGRTHFIVGLSPEEKKQIQSSIDTTSSRALPTGGTIRRVLFSPDDDLRKELLALINQEQASIRVAIFMFTDAEVAQALLNAKMRGVQVEVVTDRGCLRERFNKVSLLIERGIDVYVYTRQKNDKSLLSNIMHHKFALFGRNEKNHPLIWTGSFNFTKSARMYNQENVVILDDGLLIDKFSRQFSKLKSRCRKCRKRNNGFWLVKNNHRPKAAKRKTMVT